MARAVAAQAVRVVARFLDGRVLRGTTRDFDEDVAEFRIHENGNESSVSVPVETSALKALFFVKGPADRFSAPGPVVGRTMRVQFRDGEVITGVTVGYGADKPGFFLVPSDDDSNNLRIYVVHAAVSRVEWV